MINNLNVWAALPEIALLVAICGLILVDAFAGKQRELALDRLALASLLLPAAATLYQATQPMQYAMYGMYVADPLSHLLKFCSYLAVAAIIVYARDYGRSRGLHRSEFYVLVLFSLLGQMVMISASNLLTVYMGLELMTLAQYALAGLRRDDARSTEAALKFFVLGALASGFLLYGMSMLYGATGDLSIPAIAAAFTDPQTDRTVLILGAVFLVAGLAFKFGAVPFHMWVPDVYQGTPNSVTLLIASAPELAAFAIAFRLLAEGLLPIAVQWQPMLMVLAVASLVLGNIAAIRQTNFKRMIAYSTIAQMGFVLLGMLSGVTGGDASGASAAWGAAMFYIVTYVLTTLGTLGMILLLSRQGFECDRIDDLRGLNQKSPVLAGVMLVLMFSLTGIPPTVGFFAKLAVLQSVVDAGHVWLAVLAVMASLIGAFYYLRVVKVVYFDEPTQDLATGAGDARALMMVNGGLVLLLGIVPQPLLSACVESVRRALGL